MNKDYYIVTGANGSIGQAITEALAAQNLPVVMGCRNIAKSQPIRQRIMEKTGNSDILLLPLDLASFQSISHFCKQLVETGISIKALVNNAGVMCKDFGKTVDGFETSIGVNYIGTVFLTESLIPLMHPGSRIVMTTSLTRYIGKIDSSFFSDSPRTYKRFKAYGKSKLALTIYTAHLSMKIRDKGISMHSWVDPLANLFFRPFISSPRKGAIGAIYAASAPDTDNITGEIFTKHRHTPIPAKWRKSRQALWLQNETEKIIAGIRS